MKDTKSPLQSKTISGAVIVLVATCFTVTKMFMQEEDIDPTVLGTQVLVIVGAVLAIYGRVTAEKKITIIRHE